MLNTGRSTTGFVMSKRVNVARLLVHLFVQSPSSAHSPTIHATCNGLTDLINVTYGLLLYVNGLITNALFNSVTVVTSTLGGLSSTSSGVIDLVNFQLTTGTPSTRRPCNRTQCRCLTKLIIDIAVLTVKLSLNGRSIIGILRPAPIVFD